MTSANEMDLPMRTIEIDGQKFVVDLRQIRKVDHYKVGDRVKLLKKTYSGYETHPGTIVAIDAFKNLPTIVVAYVSKAYGANVDLEFAYLNSQSKDVEIAPMAEDDLVPTRETVMNAFAQAIKQKQAEIEVLATKREFFLRQFGTVFSVGAEEVAAATTA